MNTKKSLILMLIVLAISLVATSCDPPACTFVTHVPVVVYRIPNGSTAVWSSSTLSAGLSREILARTADDWIGFEPGIAQAENVGLGRLRYFKLNGTVSPSCLASVPLVTIAEVEADIAATGSP